MEKIRIIREWIIRFHLSLLLAFSGCWIGLNESALAADRVLVGVASEEIEIDTYAVNESNFLEIFSNAGADIPSARLGPSDSIQIGVLPIIENPESDRINTRITVDSDGDGVPEPINYDNPLYPWAVPDELKPQVDENIRVEWPYSFPADYPDETLAGTTITMFYNPETWDVEGFPEAADFDWNWYAAYFDTTFEWWGSPDDFILQEWKPRDNSYHILPNGQYKVSVEVDVNNDDVFGSDEPRQQMLFEVNSYAVTGLVADSEGAPIEGATIWVSGEDTFVWANTDKDGRFTIYGLLQDIPLNVTVSATGRVSVFIKDFMIDPEKEITNLGAFSLREAVAITGILKLDRNANGITDEPDDGFQPFMSKWGYEIESLYVLIQAWNQSGFGMGNAKAEIFPGDTSVSFSIDIPPGTGDQDSVYQISFTAEGYAAPPVQATVGKTGVDVGNVIMSKASFISGTVKLPEPVSEWMSIDAIMVDAATPGARYWGWGSIDPYFVPGGCSIPEYTDEDVCEESGGEWTDDEWVDDEIPKDSGVFTFDGVPGGTYHLEITMMGYKTKRISDITVELGKDIDLGEILMDRGSVITGTLTIQGDTRGVKVSEDDTGEGELYLWVEAWSPSYDHWSGTEVDIPRGVNVSVPYTIGGLENENYELYSWVGKGYELTDADGQSPVMVRLENRAEVDLIVKPFEGMITGTISGEGVEVDLTKMAILVKRPWDWQPPKLIMAANGGIDPTTGQFAVKGLGTGDYAVIAGSYANLASFVGLSVPAEGSAVGIRIERVSVQNDPGNPTQLDIVFSRGYSISGTVRLSADDPPWHDFGDGAGGAANGVRDTVEGENNEDITIAADLAFQPVKAIPMDMYYMGDMEGEEFAGFGLLQDNGDGTASYSINGLAPGAYLVVTPFSSARINLIVDKMTDIREDADFFTGGENVHHWTTRRETVVISGQDVTGVDFTLANGYTVSGRLTLPENQTIDTANVSEDMWEWIGHLELETPEGDYLGHGGPLFKRDFYDSDSYDFSFRHVADGDYFVYFWTDRYISGGVRTKVDQADVTANLTIQKGVNLVGRLVDAETGEGVTAKDGVTVICESDPPEDGTYRETYDAKWSQSYIEDDSGLRGGNGKQENGSGKVNTTPGKFHLTAVEPGHSYIIYVYTENGQKTGGAKNYVDKLVAGIEVPDTATGDFDVGEILLTEGVAVRGRLTDAEGNPVPAVDVEAVPSDTHDGVAESMGVSDAQGYYTIYGIDPNISYYDLYAAPRPWLFDDWGRKVRWGEKRRYNVQPSQVSSETGLTEGASFTLSPATASLSGTVTIPQSADFMLPFTEAGEDYPAAYILLQKKGVVYKDTLDGIEGVTPAMPPEAVSSVYAIDHIEPGTYKIIFMNRWLPATILDNITFKENEHKVLNATWDVTAYRIYGAASLSDGDYPGGSDISGVVCINTSDRSLIFGRLYQDADGKYSSYDVPGLSRGDAYQLIFYKDAEREEELPEVYPAGDVFTVGNADIPYDAVITRNLKPILTLQAIPDADNPGVIQIGIFSNRHLTDNTVSIVGTEPTIASTAGELFLKSGNGTLSDPVFSEDRRSIGATYTKGDGDGTVELTLAVHYGENAVTVLETLSFNAESEAFTSDVVNLYLAESVKLGNGDGTQVYAPSGAMESSDKGAVVLSIEKYAESASVFRRLSRRSDETPALPDGVTAVSNIYEISAVEAGTGNEPTVRTAVMIQLQYDPDRVVGEDTESLHIRHLKDGAWIREETGLTLDTENHTVSAEVSTLSLFVAAQGAEPSEGQTGSQTTATTSLTVADTDSSDCFIGTAGGMPVH